VAGRHAGEFVLIVTQDAIFGQLRRNVLISVVLSILATALAAIGSATLVRRTLRPLKNLDRAIEDVSITKKFSTFVEPTSRDEFGRLTSNFNTMLSELGHYDAILQDTMANLTVARDAAERASLIKSQFLANMSHEIRTPLNGVLGMAAIMARHPLAEDQRERLEVVRKSGGSLLALLNDLLDLSNIESGHMEIEQSTLDIEKVAGGVRVAFTSIAAANAVSLSVTVDPNAKGLWRGDAARLRQILSSLISNALKFTSQGEVRVEIAATDMEGARALSIKVVDTGIGIAPEVLPGLFERFVQADNTTTRRFGGAGLGLTICRHLVDLMGGRIDVESRLGEGAAFTVVLPLAWLGEARQPA
jgi:signal transduction histidine kinase